MLDHLRQQIATTLAPTQYAALATTGPAGLQADLLPCMARELHIYLLLPSTSDHLLNLENDPQVVLTTAEWQVHGQARVLGVAERQAAGALLDAPAAPWGIVVDIQPTRLTIAHPGGWGAAETIDLEQ
ncbi:MAG TPA: pyridoxamine 5'-phosphate oxidase family protein [Roseiflexaceae bacterium]|nr:pyridoxamine 5'-phosphate oxidase family protein [Roseiflexaceae bacterium]